MQYERIINAGDVDFVCAYIYDISMNMSTRRQVGTETFVSEFNKDTILCMYCETPANVKGLTLQQAQEVITIAPTPASTYLVITIDILSNIFHFSGRHVISKISRAINMARFLWMAGGAVPPSAEEQKAPIFAYIWLRS